ncbi:hypothetical protein F7725_010700 [Dissostichus mawsoni]|uniref:Uncharacterized protein n=1 Tax=Dissostichus mawsoni TaxID=36200 RepID=A0A7J5XPC4_DISMA|nr:hypothetical protein F7725_010700 [Dissostichus mawsoni]
MDERIRNVQNVTDYKMDERIRNVQNVTDYKMDERIRNVQNVTDDKMDERIRNVQNVTDYKMDERIRNVQNVTDYKMDERIRNVQNVTDYKMDERIRNVQNVTDDKMDERIRNVQNVTDYKMDERIRNVQNNVTDDKMDERIRNVQNVTDYKMDERIRNVQNVTDYKMDERIRNVQNVTDDKMDERIRNVQNVTDDKMDERIRNVQNVTDYKMDERIRNVQNVTDYKMDERIRNVQNLQRGLEVGGGENRRSVLETLKLQRSPVDIKRTTTKRLTSTTPPTPQGSTCPLVSCCVVPEALQDDGEWKTLLDPSVRGDQESSEVPGGQSAQQHQTQLDSIFTLLEDHIVTFVKSELKKIQKALSSDYPECLESQSEDEEVLEAEDEEQRRSREAFLNITLHFLRSMKQEELADRLQSSKRDHSQLRAFPSYAPQQRRYLCSLKPDHIESKASDSDSGGGKLLQQQLLRQGAASALQGVLRLGGGSSGSSLTGGGSGTSCVSEAPPDRKLVCRDWSTCRPKSPTSSSSLFSLIWNVLSWNLFPCRSFGGSSRHLSRPTFMMSL